MATKPPTSLWSFFYGKSVTGHLKSYGFKMAAAAQLRPHGSRPTAPWRFRPPPAPADQWRRPGRLGGHDPGPPPGVSDGTGRFGKKRWVEFSWQKDGKIEGFALFQSCLISSYIIN